MESQQSAPIKLPVLATVREVYVVWFENWRLWLKLSVIPLIFVIAVSFVADGQIAPDADFGLSLFVTLIYLVQIPLATAWHRLILQPDQTDGHRYAFGLNERLYFFRVLILMMFVIGLIILVGILSSFVAVPLVGLMPNSPVFQTIIMTFVIGGSVYLVVGYFVCPLLLMLPAASVGRKLRNGDAYAIVRDGRNNGRLLIAYLFVSAPIMFINWAVVEISEKLNSGSGVLANIVEFAPEVLYTPALVGVISIAYRELVQKPELSGETPA